MIIYTLNILLLIILALIPILIWWYSFSYINNSILNTRRFIIWIVAWGISVLPVLYFEEILKYFWIPKEFSILYNIWIQKFEVINTLFSFIITVLVISSLSFAAWYILIEKVKETWKTYLKNILIINFLVIIFLVIYFFITKWYIFWDITKNELNIWNNKYYTLWMIVLYYILVWLFEETSKHFNFLSSSLTQSDTIKKWVLYWIFIALWFAFIENILYLKNIFDNKWFSSDIFVTLFFRWIFSIFVHIYCSSIVTKSFMKWYLNNNKKVTIYSKIILIWFIISIWMHAIYDISLTFDFTAIIFLYLFIWYFYITNIFYKDNFDLK